MTQHHIDDMEDPSIVHGIEEDHSPEGVQEDHGQGLSGTGQEEDIRSTVQSHCRWSHGIRQNIHQSEQSTDDPETQTRDIGQDVLVLSHSHVIRDFLESFLCLAKDLVDDEPEAFLDS